MKLDLTKKVQTRDGRPVEIKLTDGRGDYPILGYIGDGHKLISWTSDGVWKIGTEDYYDLINAPEWHLPDPPQGYEWHRTDWTEEMLPDGWRPLLVGEAYVAGDEWTRSPNQHWRIETYTGANKVSTGEVVYKRTRRPLPPPKPQLREVPLCDDDIKAGDEFLAPSGSRYAWTHITTNCIHLDLNVRTFESLMEGGWKIRSIGETEWRKCSKMEEVTA